MKKIVLLNGSLGQNSVHQALLNAIQKHAPADVECESLPIGHLPLFRIEDENHADYLILREKISAADAVLIASPEYNSSVTAALKNAIDIASRPYGAHAWKGKKIAVVSTSPSEFGAVNSNQHARDVLQFLGAEVMPATLHLPHSLQIFQNGDVVDSAAAQQISDFAAQFFKNL